VVFDDYDGATTQDTEQNGNLEGGLFMVKILEYLEVPQYLRRALIPMHRSLSSVVSNIVTNLFFLALSQATLRSNQADFFYEQGKVASP
jgi:predicted SPOUT superfamily RNA methylase MTH1